jgi:hypothetical protein
MSTSQSTLPDDRHHSRSSTTSSFLTFPVTYAVSGLMRRLSSDPSVSTTSQTPSTSSAFLTDSNGSFPAAYQRSSPFRPPPLSPLTLRRSHEAKHADSKLLATTLAEEIRLLIPARLQLLDEWRLVYSLAENGVSLSTLYKRAEALRGKRGGYVLVIRDGDGGVSDLYKHELEEVSTGANLEHADLGFRRVSIRPTQTQSSLLRNG